MTDIAQQLERRRRAVAADWNLGREVVLVGAGDPVAVPGRGDLTYPFRSHSEYLYLTDRERPGGVLAFDPDEGWVDFVVPVTREEMLWEGAPATGSEGVPVANLDGWLAERDGRPIARLGAPAAGVDADGGLGSELRRGLNRVRRRKDAVELERMRAAARATRAGFALLPSLIRPGATEREVQIELEAEFFRHGARSTAYDSIVGGGPNAAVRMRSSSTASFRRRTRLSPRRSSAVSASSPPAAPVGAPRRASGRPRRRSSQPSRRSTGTPSPSSCSAPSHSISSRPTGTTKSIQPSSGSNASTPPGRSRSVR